MIYNLGPVRIGVPRGRIGGRIGGSRTAVARVVARRGRSRRYRPMRAVGAVCPVGAIPSGADRPRRASDPGIEEALQVVPAKADLATLAAYERKVAAVTPGAHGVPVHTGEPGGLGEREHLSGRARPRSKSHLVWRSSSGAGVHPAFERKRTVLSGTGR